MLRHVSASVTFDVDLKMCVENTGHLKLTRVILTAEMYWLLKQAFSWVGEVMDE